MNKWGKIIRELRVERGMSQRLLAFEADVNRSTLCRIEDGRAIGRVDIIEDVLAVLDYDLEALKVDVPEPGQAIKERRASPNRLLKKGVAYPAVA